MTKMRNGKRIWILLVPKVCTTTSVEDMAVGTVAEEEEVGDEEETAAGGVSLEGTTMFKYAFKLTI